MSAEAGFDASKIDDPSLLVAIAKEIGDARRAQVKEWTTTHELLAQMIDLLSVMRVENAVGRLKPLPKSHRVARPWETKKEGGEAMSPRNFARMLAGV